MKQTLTKNGSVLYTDNELIYKTVPKTRKTHWFHFEETTDDVITKWFETYTKRFNNHSNFATIQNLKLPNYFEIKKINGMERHNKLKLLLADKNGKKIISKILKQYKNAVEYMLSFQDDFLHVDLARYRNVIVESDTNRLLIIDPDGFVWLPKSGGPFTPWNNYLFHHCKMVMYKNLADIKRLEI